MIYDNSFIKLSPKTPKYSIFGPKFKCLCTYKTLTLLFFYDQRRIQGLARVAHAPLFLQSLVFLGFFCNPFQELQTVLFEDELIINNASLTYVYPNTIETCLTVNNLLFARQLLYSSNITSTVVRNLTVRSNTTDNIKRISNHFLDS